MLCGSRSTLRINESIKIGPSFEAFVGLISGISP